MKKLKSQLSNITFIITSFLTLISSMSYSQIDYCKYPLKEDEVVTDFHVGEILGCGFIEDPYLISNMFSIIEEELSEIEGNINDSSNGLSYAYEAKNALLYASSIDTDLSNLNIKEINKNKQSIENDIIYYTQEISNLHCHYTLLMRVLTEYAYYPENIEKLLSDVGNK
ncbi:hypothetical protein N9N67_07895 [Bacteriovoracaceae bacterium]|nr:hypothetical protein [Bacteriovoracaceae bacterium]